MRLFIGIKLDEVAHKKVMGIMDNLYSQGFRGNFTNKNNIHLTLSFLGDVDENKVDELIDIINTKDIWENDKNNTLNITKVKTLKDMIVLEVELTKQLQELQAKLANKLKNKGYKLENRPYYPHITLVRQYTSITNKQMENMEIDINSNFKKIILFESKRIRKDLVYISLN